MPKMKQLYSGSTHITRIFQVYEKNISHLHGLLSSSPLGFSSSPSLPCRCWRLHFRMSLYKVLLFALIKPHFSAIPVVKKKKKKKIKHIYWRMCIVGMTVLTWSCSSHNNQTATNSIPPTLKYHLASTKLMSQSSPPPPPDPPSIPTPPLSSN